VDEKMAMRVITGATLTTLSGISVLFLLFLWLAKLHIYSKKCAVFGQKNAFSRFFMPVSGGKHKV